MIKKKLTALAIIAVLALSVPAPAYSLGLHSLKNLKQKTESVKKSEAKHVFGKFFKSMLMVAGSCGAIFLILLAYRRFTTVKIVQPEEIDVEKNLNSPETVEEATKFVIEKF